MRRFSFAFLGLAVLSLAVVGSRVIGQGKGEDAKHDPKNAVANLDVHPQLEATLFASEPQITNPTNLDIDSRGRIWICDVKNYRGNNGKRPEGDRILILEDQDGDGKADTVKTFYQGRDIDSAMGICVLGDKVIVSATPNIFVFTKDANDKILKKEALFTKSGSPQHDHSLHSFYFGPDGKYYFNYGNTGNSLNDKDGKPVIDMRGKTVAANGQPYRQGMAFRCDPDGSNVEVLGHNFRNNYECVPDSFANVWQSDNDDDGNQGVRINFVMEGGNFGYTDEITGAGWGTKRTNLEKEIKHRHWHLNDPGVVPNLLQTGAGSPTGICVYEGSLLPKEFHNQVIHCEPGSSVVRAYPVTVDGAGYKAEILNILDGNKKNNWFRPADVCVAPDGSLFVTDWYDPGVGGHAQRDIDRGRIFRVAPKGSKYTIPALDLSNAAGAIEALKSPNAATRYLAYQKLLELGEEIEVKLRVSLKSELPHERARALWVYGKLPMKAEDGVKMALSDIDPKVRQAGIRMAREWKLPILPIVARMANDNDAGVLRECAIALRDNKDAQAAILWGTLARKYDGKDRWYLEALGIGADGNWDACLDAFKGSQVDDKVRRDIIWRSRGSSTPALLTELITSKTTPEDELPRLFRAFDFQPASAAKETALTKAFFGKIDTPFVVGESLARLKSFNVKDSPEALKALNNILDKNKGTPLFVDYVGRFNIPGRETELLAMAQKSPNDQAGVDAMRLLVDRSLPTVKSGVEAKDVTVAVNTLAALANAANPKANDLLISIVTDGKADLELRRQATRALGRNKDGAVALVNLETKKQLAKELHAAAGAVLHQGGFKDVKTMADKYFPLPASKDNTPLPKIADLAKLKGEVKRGQEIFAKVGTCANCHVVNGQGKEVGPNLSEIGKKLAKEAMYESILYPSAGISHNFDTWIVETKKGEVVTGLLVSQTPAEVVLKEATALTRTLPRADIDTLSRSPISLMPADLTKTLSAQDLADVVEYMTTLKEAKK